MEYPLLTIIIPTINRRKHLEILITALELLPHKNLWNCYIVDNCSSFDLSELVTDLAPYINIRYVRWSQTTGSFERSMKLFLMSQPELSSYIWILGDDDLPSRSAFSLLIKTLCEARDEESDCAWLHIFCPNIQSNDCSSNAINFNSTHEYYTYLSAGQYFDSIYGFTFCSNVILPRLLFERAFGPLDRLSISRLTHSSLPTAAPATATCQSIPAALAREQWLHDYEWSVKLHTYSLVSVAFNVDLPIQARNNSIPNATLTENELKHLRSREICLNWINIFGSWKYISCFHGTSAANWFREMLIYYLNMLSPGIVNILNISRGCTIEMLLLSKAMKTIVCDVDKKKYYNLNILCERMTNLGSPCFSETSLPILFTPFAGWIQSPNSLKQS